MSYSPLSPGIGRQFHAPRPQPFRRGIVLIPAREIPEFLTSRKFLADNSLTDCKDFMSTEAPLHRTNKEGGTMNRKLHQHLRDAPRGTLKALANHLGVRYQTVQKWVSGERPLTKEDYDRCLVFLIGFNHINRRYQGSASGTVVYPSRFKLLPTPTPIKTSMGELMKAFWLIKQELLRAAGAAPPDRHAILDYLHQA